KTGVDGIFSPVHEALQYTITDPRAFLPGTLPNFPFPYQQKWDVEPSIYVQDQMRLGRWNISAGLRFDHYGFVVHESAWSPRIGISRYFPSLNFLIHAAYDRVFQTPAVVNLLLASSPQLDAVTSILLRIPLRPACAHYYVAGTLKG